MIIMSQEVDRPKLSLLAQFDDIMRYNNHLFMGVEDEFIIFLENQMGCLKKCSSAVKDVDNSRFELLKAKKEKDLVETKLKHMKSLLETEIHKRVKVENEKKSLERQISLIREVLLADQSALNDQAKEKLAFLNTNLYNLKQISEEMPEHLDTIEESMGSLFSTSDVSFDKMDEDLACDEAPTYVNTQKTKSKRGTTCQDINVQKKQKLQHPNSEENTDLAVAENALNLQGNECRTITCMTTRSKRCSSEPVPEARDLSPLRQICKSDNDQFNDLLFVNDDLANHAYTRPSPQSTPLRRFSSAVRMNRSHVFCTKTLIRSEMCLFCNRRIRFYKQALKCQECRATCHPECKEKVPLPCFPIVQTPTSKGAMGTIADYTPSTSPMIPALIVHCINEIEIRGLSEIGLYRISGSEREVKELKDKFLKGKCVPLLNKTDIHAICGTVKEFLRSLREPLIPRVMWKDFIQAAEMPNVQDGLTAVCEIVDKLPQPNRDTLSFLLLHLSNVADSPECKMPIENLSKVFGPTIVGYSVSDPSASTMISETEYQCAVMLLLLTVPGEFWQKHASSGNDVVIISTPEPRKAPEGNILGPLSSGGTVNARSHAVVFAKIPLTPRTLKSGAVKTKKQFFCSPLLQ